MLKIFFLAFLIPLLSFAHKESCAESVTFILQSKRQSDRLENRGKIFKLEKHDQGILINGRFFPEFEFRYISKIQAPVGVLSPQKKAKARVILLHGLGYEISTIYSLFIPALTLHNITEGNGSNIYSQWFNQKYPHLQFPLEIVVADVPPMGWAPSLSNFSKMNQFADYFNKINQELNEHNPLPNFYICRSASCSMGLLAGQKDAGVVITGATFPHPSVIDANIAEMKRLEKAEGNSPNWDVIHKITDLFNDLNFIQQLQLTSAKKLPVLSLIGSNDAETPEDARWLWKNLLKIKGNNSYRAQHIIQGAGHQVFKRPEHLGKDFKVTDPDITSYQLLLEFLKANIP